MDDVVVYAGLHWASGFVDKWVIEDLRFVVCGRKSETMGVFHHGGDSPEEILYLDLGFPVSNLSPSTFATLLERLL